MLRCALAVVAFSVWACGDEPGGNPPRDAGERDARVVIDAGVGPEADAGARDASTERDATVETDAGPAGPVFYVATDGDDGNPGTIEEPFRTLAHGVGALTPTATLYVRDGTYDEGLEGVPSGTSWDATVTVSGYPGERAVLHPSRGSFVVNIDGGAYIVIAHFVIDASGVGSDAVEISHDAGPPSHHVRIADCEIENAPHQGIGMDSGCDANELVRLRVHDNGTTDNLDHGIYLTTANNLIDGCEFYRNAAYGIQLYGFDGEVNDNVVRNNLIHDNARTGGGGAGMIVSRGSGNLIYNNVIWHNPGGGIFIQYGATDTGVFNNTIYEDDVHGIYNGAESAGAVIQNNIVYGAGAALLNDGSGATVSDNLVGRDPRFVDPSSADFRLQDGSPAIDTGIARPEVETDRDGTPRPRGAGYDMGAYER